jgi:hypothetical protein
MYQAALHQKGGPWEFYRLVMTQWPLQLDPTQPIPPDQNGAPGFTFPGANNHASAFANVTLETFDQTDIRKSCMACHTITQQATDFLWSLEINAFPGTLSPPSQPPLSTMAKAAPGALSIKTMTPEIRALRDLLKTPNEK